MNFSVWLFWGRACHPQTSELAVQLCNTLKDAEIQYEPFPRPEWQALCIQGSSPICPHSPPCKHVTEGHRDELWQAPTSGSPWTEVRARLVKMKEWVQETGTPAQEGRLSQKEREGMRRWQQGLTAKACESGRPAFKPWRFSYHLSGVGPWSRYQISLGSCICEMGW